MKRVTFLFLISFGCTEEEGRRGDGVERSLHENERERERERRERERERMS